MQSLKLKCLNGKKREEPLSLVPIKLIMTAACEEAIILEHPMVNLYHSFLKGLMTF